MVVGRRSGLIALLVAALAGGMCDARPARAQEADTAVHASGLGVSTTDFLDEFRTSTASLNFFEFSPEKKLWLVAGQGYRGNSGANEFDLGLKYLFGDRRMLRLTLDADSVRKGSSDISLGLDGQVVVARPGNLEVMVMGDISTVEDNGMRFSDYGMGTNLAIGSYNLFGLYSNRGMENQGDWRAGYMFLGDGLMHAAMVDFASWKNPVFAGFLSLDNTKLIVGYDAEKNKFSTVDTFSFGNKPFPAYARFGFITNQVLWTKRSVKDSDFTQFFPAQFFVNPVGRVGNVLSTRLYFNTSGWELDEAKVYNAFGVRNGDKGIWLFTQNWDRIRVDGRHLDSFGAGLGYDFGNFTLLLREQVGDRKIFGIDLEYGF